MSGYYRGEPESVKVERARDLGLDNAAGAIVQVAWTIAAQIPVRATLQFASETVKEVTRRFVDHMLRLVSVQTAPWVYSSIVARV